MKCILRNSEVHNKEFRFHYRDFTTMNYSTLFALDDRIEADLVTVTNSADAQNLRDDVGADLVVLMTNARYGFPNGFAGVAWPYQGVDMAYSVVAIPFALNRFTLAHEMGHNLGLRHNRSSNGGNDDADVCSRGWRINGLAQTTTLALAVTGDRLPHFSNPNVAVAGFATGTPDNDNAKTISNTACEAADFRPSPYWELDLNHPIGVCCREETFTAGCSVNQPAPGFPSAGPYRYHWQVAEAFNLTNFPWLNWASLPDEGSSLTVDMLNMGCPGPVIYVRCVVEAANGATSVAVGLVRVDDFEDPSPCDLPRSTSFTYGNTVDNAPFTLMPIPESRS